MNTASSIGTSYVPKLLPLKAALGCVEFSIKVFLFVCCFLSLVLVQQHFVPVLRVLWFVLNSVKVKRKTGEIVQL